MSNNFIKQILAEAKEFNEDDQLSEAKKVKKDFDAGKEIRAIARERVGQPKSSKAFLPKTKKPLKYKPNLDEDVTASGYKEHPLHNEFEKAGMKLANSTHSLTSHGDIIHKHQYDHAGKYVATNGNHYIQTRHRETPDGKIKNAVWSRNIPLLGSLYKDFGYDTLSKRLKNS